MAHVTIQDVATQAGVSKTTVSRYLNGHFERMSEQTRERIDAVIRELNFVPNRQASSLKTQRSRQIGVVVADIGNIYSTLLLAGMDSIARDNQTQILINTSNDNRDQEQENLQNLLAQKVDGIILQPLSSKASDYAFVRERGVPLVMVDRLTDGGEWPTVTSNDYVSSRELADRVIAAGYTDIVVFTRPIGKISTRVLRTQAFEEVASDTVSVTIVESKDGDAAPLDATLKSHAGKHPLVFAVNGQMLLTLLRYAHQQNLRIPEDLAVCGYDDWDWAELASPGITSITQHPELIGNRAASFLFAAIRGEAVAARHHTVAAQLNVRQSF